MAAKKRIKIKEGIKRKSFLELKQEKEQAEALKKASLGESPNPLPESETKSDPTKSLTEELESEELELESEELELELESEELESEELKSEELKTEELKTESLEPVVESEELESEELETESQNLETEGVLPTDYNVRGKYTELGSTTGISIGDLITGGFVNLPESGDGLPFTDTGKKETTAKVLREHLNSQTNVINGEDLHNSYGGYPEQVTEDKQEVSLPETESEEQVIEESLTATESEEQVIEESLTEIESEEQVIEESVTATESEEQVIEESLTETESDDSHVATVVTGERGDSYLLDIDLPAVAHANSEMYEALVAYSEGGDFGDEPADLRGITHINVNVFDDMYGVSQKVLVGTDNTETIELPYEGRYIGVQHIKGIMLSPIQKEVKTTYYVGSSGHFYLAANDLKRGKPVNLAGEYIDTVDPEQGVEAILVQKEHTEGVTFEYKIRDLTDVNKRLGLNVLTTKQSVKNKANKKSFFSRTTKKAKGDEMSKDVKPTKKPVKQKAASKPNKQATSKNKKGKPQQNKPYSRYSKEKPTLLNSLSSKAKAFLMGLGFMILLFVVGSRLFAPSNTVDYLTFNEKETLVEVSEESFGKAYVSKLEKQALIYFEPRHKEVKVAFLEYLEAYMNTGDSKIKKDLDTITVQYFTNLEYVQNQALIKYNRNKQQGDTSELTLNFEKNHNKIQEVLGGSLKDYTGRVMNGYSDTATLRNLLGVTNNQETSAFLSAFTDNIFYVYYNYVINQTDELLAGVTDDRSEEVQDEQETINSEQTLEEAQENQE